MEERILEPVFQYGFAGMSAILLGIIVWLIKRLLGIFQDTNAVIAGNTRAIEQMVARSIEQTDLLHAVHEKLLSRPCIASRENPP